MATNEPTRKKRRIRAAEQAGSQTVTKQTEKPSKEKKSRTSHGALKPFMWLGRHIVPRYIKNSFKELRNITWPTRKQSRQLTLAVIIFATVFAIIISLVDYGLDKAFRKVFLHE